MQNRFLQLFRAPRFERTSENRLAGILHNASGFLALLAFPGIFLAPILDPGVPETTVLVVVIFGLGLLTNLLNRLGLVRYGSVLLAAGLWALTTYAIVTQGGMGTPFIFLYFAVLLLCNLLLGTTATVFAGVLTSLTLLLIMLLQQEMLIYTSNKVSLEQLWATFTLVFVLSGLLLALDSAGLRRVLRGMRQAQSELEQTNRELAAVQSDLEARITARTADLQRRTQYLEASNEISRTATSAMDFEELAQRVVDQILERFGLYYTGLFMVDDSREWARLRAGTGAAGQAMLARSHRIKVGTGMIGWCIANAQPRVALSAHEDMVRLLTSELPETRSEAALPLRSRGQVLGALSIQSRAQNAFDSVTLGALQSVADQVAIAIDNSRLLAESREALHLAQQAYGESTGRAWEALVNERATSGYLFRHGQIQPLAESWRPAMLEAVRSGGPVLAPPAATNGGELTLPLKSRGKTIGAFSFRKVAGQTWTEEEIRLLQNLLEQLAQALESARLYRETQRQAARERLSGEVVAQMRASLDVEAVLQTAIREIAERLSIPQVEVHLTPRPAEQIGN